MQSLGNLLDWSFDQGTLTLRTEEAEVQITALAPDLIRVTFMPGGLRPYKSWAVIKHDWPAAEAELTNGPDALRLSTSGVTVTVTKAPVRIQFTDPAGRIIVEDQQGLCYADGKVGWRQAAAPDSHYYGFGQKMGFLDKNGRAMTLWTTDEPLHTPTTDLLYQAIPFYLGLKEGKAYGLFLDSTAKVHFDMNKFGTGVNEATADTHAVDAYFFAGPDPKAVIGRYTELTGRMELPPKWALGYQQCRWSYYPESRVREIAENLRERKIPSDVIYLDIDYMDGYRVFTWDQERFPDPERLVADLGAQGFKVVTIIDPGVKVDAQYDVFIEGVRDGHFVCHEDGELFIGTVWPGKTAFPDFTRASARKWWGDWHKESLLDVGIAGIWNDMNEPSCFARNTFAETTVQGEEEELVPHAQVHNAYGFLMSRATFEGLKRHQPEKRPFILTRSGYAGIQRYSAVWMGDNHSWWEHLLNAMPMCMSMGLSGVPFVGTDIGGFSEDATGELLARWTQMGAFTPFCRNHAAQGTRDQEPWVFGEAIEAICREYIELRYRMLPFLYNEFVSASRTGLPVMRPLLLEYPADPNTHNLSDQFLVGRDLLVCPVYHPGATKRMVYLPEGTWVDFHTGEALQGGTYVVADAPLARMPLYVRGGAIIPMGPVIQHTGEAATELILNVYAKGAESGRLELYEDDGESVAYQRGEYAITEVRFDADDRAQGLFTLTMADPVGRFRPYRERVTVRLNLDTPSKVVRVNGERVEAKRARDGALEVTVPTPGAAGFSLTLS